MNEIEPEEAKIGPKIVAFVKRHALSIAAIGGVILVACKVNEINKTVEDTSQTHGAMFQREICRAYKAADEPYEWRNGSCIHTGTKDAGEILRKEMW